MDGKMHKGGNQSFFSAVTEGQPIFLKAIYREGEYKGSTLLTCLAKPLQMLDHQMRCR